MRDVVVVDSRHRRSFVESGHGRWDFIRDDRECRDEIGGSFACGFWVTMKDTLSMVIYNRDAEVEEGKRRLVGFEFFTFFWRESYF